MPIKLLALAGDRIMMGFFDYIEWHRGRGLPDTHTMLTLAGLSLHIPSKKRMRRAVDRAKDRLVVTIQSVAGGLGSPG